MMSLQVRHQACTCSSLAGNLPDFSCCLPCTFAHTHTHTPAHTHTHTHPHTHTHTHTPAHTHTHTHPHTPTHPHTCSHSHTLALAHRLPLVCARRPVTLAMLPLIWSTLVPVYRATQTIRLPDESSLIMPKLSLKR